MKKQKLLVVLLAFIVISLFFAYYLFFVSNDAILNSAKVRDLDVIFYKVGKIEQNNSFNASATINEGNKKIFINVDKLIGKGAYVKIPVTIKNVGKATARLDSIYEYNFNKNEAISITYEGIGVTNKPLLPNEQLDFYIIISLVEDINKIDVTTNFEIRFNYIQVGGKYA